MRAGKTAPIMYIRGLMSHLSLVWNFHLENRECIHLFPVGDGALTRPKPKHILIRGNVAAQKPAVKAAPRKDAIVFICLCKEADFYKTYKR